MSEKQRPTITHEELVRRLKKPGEDILATITAEKLDLMHMAVGMAEEAGELLGAIKAFVFYNKELDLDHVAEELGDFEFFVQGLRQILRLTREETLDGNIRKLSQRYQSLSYNDLSAKQRLDKSLKCRNKWHQRAFREIDVSVWCPECGGSNYGRHDLYERDDEDVPSVLLDSNGDVALGMCRRCGKAEVQLDDPFCTALTVSNNA